MGFKFQGFDFLHLDSSFSQDELLVRARRRQMALVYLARPCGMGRARSGYVELVVAAALAWELPPDYVASLQQWLPAHPIGSGVRKLGEFGWT